MAPAAVARKEGPAARSTAAGKLSAYKAKRDFTKSPEPAAKRSRAVGHRFAIQRHDARRLHFDLRLELGGVLKSWAVTRGPSLDPADKRLSIHTEDHPLEYLSFEGVIPDGEYGGGTMIVWDHGTWTPDGDAEAAIAKGHLSFTLAGERLRGGWHLIRMRPRAKEKKEQWLLVKVDDEHALASVGGKQLVDAELTSILTGRTNAELAAGGAIRKDHAARRKVAAAKPSSPRARVPKAKKALLPVFLEPSLATLVEKAPAGPEWLHEIKHDGYRLQARIDGHSVKLLTRKGLDWTSKFGAVADGLRELKLGSALIDGEVVVEAESGISSFSLLQEAISAGRSDRMVFYAFDLLYVDGSSLEATPLVERKTQLAALLDDVPAGGSVRFSEHIDDDGVAMARHACRLGLEGIVSKRKDQPYRPGRGTHWLKTKCIERQEFVIAGFVPSTTSPKAVGSLILGDYENGKLVYVGRAGTGFTDRVARELWAALDPIKRTTAPFAAKPSVDAARGARWVEPRLVAEVELRGWTADGLLRHAAYKGLREDKDAVDVIRESPKASASAAAKAPSPIASHTFDLTHPDRVLWPDVGLTKQGLAEYYAEVADWILPHVVDRPLSLLRGPNGIGGKCFFQKHAWDGIGEAVQRQTIAGEEILSIRNLDGLVALVQAGSLEIHPWGSKLKDIEHPDRIVFDLDPDEGLTWDAVVEGALEVRERLRHLKLESFVKTSGGKGLHVVVPVAPKVDWATAKAFAKHVVEAMAKDSPDRYTANVAKRARADRIFIDYLRNGRGATAVAPYSTRARAGAPVSVPIGWDELTAGIRPNQFDVQTLPARLRHAEHDAWAGIGKLRQRIDLIRG
ncbi:DNA ligase D [Aureimonas leprariae]|uniref:DNA ligase (ATP) n=1 Tax=Plantimonas leprariae TaxID=2615207 RepID=A0A7V7PMD0_9HYPH|nr:DNA ligase D [Aureimonas leprariae]KAB0678065.1 DNA ligase D [Aureimonas leprariae]